MLGSSYLHVVTQLVKFLTIFLISFQTVAYVAQI